MAKVSKVRQDSDLVSKPSRLTTKTSHYIVLLLKGQNYDSRIHYLCLVRERSRFGDATGPSCALRAEHELHEALLSWDSITWLTSSRTDSLTVSLYGCYCWRWRRKENLHRCRMLHRRTLQSWRTVRICSSVPWAWSRWDDTTITTRIHSRRIHCFLAGIHTQNCSACVCTNQSLYTVTCQLGVLFLSRNISLNLTKWLEMQDAHAQQLPAEHQHCVKWAQKE